MAKLNLSNFDKLLQQQEEAQRTLTFVEDTSEYSGYRVTQSQPESAEKVSACKPAPETGSPNGKKNKKEKTEKNSKFTKFGKFIFASYVLIVAGLALLIVVSTNKPLTSASEGATASPVVAEDSEIRKMPLETNKSQSYESLFDEICDSLK